MPKSPYQEALEEAVEEQRTLTQERAELDTRIARLRETIVTLLRLLALKGEPIDVTQVFEEEEMPEDEGKTSLTEAIGDLLKARDAFMTASQIMAGLTGIGFDVERYAEPLPTITTTLTRLVQSGDVISDAVRGKSVYKWNTSAFRHSPLKYLGQRSKGLRGLREAAEQPAWWQHLREEAAKGDEPVFSFVKRNRPKKGEGLRKIIEGNKKKGVEGD